jgi:hypothetical protein
MDSGAEVRFAKGVLYTRGQIRGVVGGSTRAALPTRGGKVVCVCLTIEKNPRAPREMVIGGNERALRRARQFAASGEAVPVFVRRNRGCWEFAGARRVRAVIEAPGALLAMVAEGAPPEISAALQFEEAVGCAPGPAGVDDTPRPPGAAPGA